MTNIKINSERLLKSLKTMGKVGKNLGDHGITRLALSQEDKDARDLLIQWLRAENLEIKIDRVGNIFGIRDGTEAGNPPIVSGSHLDTVRNSGIYDGALGVLGALEVVRVLNEEEIQTRQPIAVACFTNEEGARFQPDMMGSAVLSGVLRAEEALSKKDDNGISVKEALIGINYNGRDSLIPGKYLELHIEQGPLLYEKKLDIGVVEGIQGIAWWQGSFTGEANHAGTTPLQYRKDALLACSELCCELRKLAETHGVDSVSTMGRLNVQPDVINVIPQKAAFTIDFRQYEPKMFEKGKSLVEKLVKNIAEKHKIECCLENIANVAPVRFDSRMVNLVETKTGELNVSYTRLHSGAGHDAGLLSHICPASMIFVPSIKGKSHSPEEKTSTKDVVNGANLLLKCILSLGNAQQK